MVVALNHNATVLYALACLTLALVTTSSAARTRGAARLAWLALGTLCGLESATAAWLTQQPPPDPPDAYLRPEQDPAFAAPWLPDGAPLYAVPRELVDRAPMRRSNARALRVLFLGDSFTAGAGVRRDQAFPAEVGRLLASAGAPVEVFNHGVLGYSTLDEDALYQAWSSRFDADVVVLGVLINDLEERGFSAAAGALQVNELMSPDVAWSPRPPLLWATVSHLRDLRAVGAQTEAQYRRGWTDPTTLAAFRAHLASIAERAHAGGAALIVARIPLLHALDADAFPWQATALRQAAESVGATYVDLFPAVEGLEASTLWVASFDHHPNARAHARLAPPLAAAIAGTHATPTPSPGDAPDPRELLQRAARIVDPVSSTPDCKTRPGVSPTLAQIAIANRDLLPVDEQAALVRDALPWAEYPKSRCSP